MMRVGVKHFFFFVPEVHGVSLMGLKRKEIVSHGLKTFDNDRLDLFVPIMMCTRIKQVDRMKEKSYLPFIRSS